MPGDLAFRQIFPALAGLIRDNGWTMPIIGLARHGDLAALRDRATQSLAAQVAPKNTKASDAAGRDLPPTW